MVLNLLNYIDIFSVFVFTCTNAQMPAEYNLMDNDPYCFPYPDLCSNNNANQEGVHSTIDERQMFAIHNLARQGPSEFQSYYGSITYSCSPNVQPAAEWESNLNQAAKKQSEMMSDPDCPFSHSTCGKYSSLFGGSTNTWVRVSTFNTSANGEIIYGGGNALGAMSAWFKSAGHCSIIFGGSKRAGYGRFQSNACGLVNGAAHQYKNPIKSGSHFEGNVYSHSVAAGSNHFMASYYSPELSASNVFVVIDGQNPIPMTLTTGSTTNGGYTVNTPVSNCSSYFFQASDTNGTMWRMPETGDFIIQNGAACSKQTASFVYSDGSVVGYEDGYNTNSSALIGTSVAIGFLTLLLLALLIAILLQIIKMKAIQRVWEVYRIIPFCLTVISMSLLAVINRTYFAEYQSPNDAFIIVLITMIYLLLTLVACAVYEFKGDMINDKLNNTVKEKMVPFICLSCDFILTCAIGIAGVLVASVSYQKFTGWDENIWIAAVVFTFISWVFMVFLTVYTSLWVVSQQNPRGEVFASKPVAPESSAELTLSADI